MNITIKEIILKKNLNLQLIIKRNRGVNEYPPVS